MRRSTILEFLNRLPTLTGKKVRLRPRRLEDAADEYRWRSDEELCRLDATDPLDFTFGEFLERYSVELEYPGLSYTLAVDTLDGIHIGDCSLFNFDLPGATAETGILIGQKAYWGQGYGVDALQTFISYIFATSDIEKLLLRTLDWNERAQKCFEKCGFSPCGNTACGEYRFMIMEIRRRQALKNGQ